ncbi:hypothetical protein JB92DRAFT_2971462 [Gautieria morchelliformis]|nr:hypothetical protein JB92DRAFT_2971462 [Gautieria morchelliformis]
MVWPGRWGLPSIDASCLEAISYLQLALPGHYSTSPSAHLPFLTHDQIIVSPSPSYISFLTHALLKPSDFQDEYEIDPSTVTQTSMQDSVHCSSHRGQLGEGTLKRSWAIS